MNGSFFLFEIASQRKPSAPDEQKHRTPVFNKEVSRSCCLLLLVLTSVANAAPVAVASVVKDTLTLDGDWVDWDPGLRSVAPPVFFGQGNTFTEEGTVKDDHDQSARLYFAIQGSDLFVGGLVADDSVVTVRHGEQWKGDGVELLFPFSKSQMMHLGINPTGDVHLYKEEKIKQPAVRGAARIEAGGWSFEFAIPLTRLGISAQTTAVPMNIAMRDVDEGEKSSAHRVWSGQRHSLAASAGRLLIDRTVQSPSRWPTCPKPIKTIELRQPLKARGKQLVAGEEPVRLRMLNFQSARRNWQEFWTDWDLPQIQRDLDVAQRLRANSIRIFVFTQAFGEDGLVPEMLERLHVVVAAAASRGMLSVVSFFPFKKEFRPEWRSRMKRHLEQVVSSFTQDPAVAMWDLMNEPDHAWALPDAKVTAEQVESWTKEMFDAVKHADETHLVTVGLFGHYLARDPVRAQEELPFVDVASVHWYGERDKLKATFKKMAATPRPLVLQEVGVSSLYFTESEAVEQLDEICKASEENGFAGLGVWELFDHSVGSIAHQKPRWSETVENHFGLVSARGLPRKQAQVFCSCGAQTIPTFRLKR
jgi:hypothetical protein